MYFKTITIVAIAIIGAFLYLHMQNDGTVEFALSETHIYSVPVTIVLFVGFTAGMVLTILNSLFLDAVKGVKGFRTRREMRRLAEAQENYRKGMESLNAGDFRTARHHLARAVNTRPDEASMVIALSETYVREGGPREALRVLEEGVLKSPGSAGLHLAIAASSEEAGDLFRASRALEDVLRLDPGNPHALKRLRDIKIKEGNWSEAAELEKKVLEGTRDDSGKKREKKLIAGILFEAASRLSDEGRLDAAAAKLKEMSRFNGPFKAADILSADIQFRQGRVTESLMALEEALGRYSDACPVLLKMEEIFIKKSAPEKAIDRYRKEVYTRPADIRVKQLLARLYLRLEMTDDALDELTRVYNESEDDPYTRVLLAEAYLRTGDIEKAAGLFEKSLGLSRDLPPPFVCATCAEPAPEWKGRCPVCGEWNTLEMNTSAAACETEPGTAGKAGEIT